MLPKIMFGLKGIVADMGPGTAFCTNWPVTESIYMTVAVEMLTVPPENVPWGTFINEIGCMVPIRCIISTGVAEDTTVTEPPPVLASVMEPIVMLTATSRSDGPSPIFTWREVVFGWGFGFWEEVAPPQANRNSSDRVTTAHAINLMTCDCNCPN